MTTHYSAPELNQLLEGANKVVEAKQPGILLTALRRREVTKLPKAKPNIGVSLLTE